MNNYEEPTIDYDTGEPVEEKKVDFRKAYDKLIGWADDYQGSRLVNMKPREYKALADMRKEGRTMKEIKQRFIELKATDFWKEKGISFVYVRRNLNENK